MRRELKYAGRSLFHRPGFSFIVILTLAIGIGANAAIFSLVNGLLLSNPPYKNPERLVRVMSQRGNETGMLSIREIYDLREQARLFEGFASMRNTQYNVTGGGPPEALRALVNTHNLFELLGIRPLLGDVWPFSHEGQPVFEVVIGYDLWKSRFGGDREIIGKPITLDGAPYRVLGVMPPGFNFPLNAQLYRRVPQGDLASRSIRESSVLARLRSGVTIEQAQEELNAIATRWEQMYPDTNKGLRLEVASFREGYIGTAGPYLLLLMGAVVFVLLMACVNIVNLMLARAVSREKEFAIRAALGATRWTLVRHTLVETGLLTVFGGALGLGFSFLALSAAKRLFAFSFPDWMKLNVDLRVIAFTLLLCVIVCLTTGVVPALRAGGLNSHESLKLESRGTQGSGKNTRARQLLVVSQISLALVLLVCAGLMTASFLHLQRVALGFETEHLLTLKMDPPWFKYKLVSQTAPFYRRVIEELSRIPGIDGAAFNDSLPLAGQDVREGANRLNIEIEGQSNSEKEHNPYVNAQIVSYDYFHTLRVPLDRGRYFDQRDQVNTTVVAVVSQRAAERFWPHSDPIGQRLRLTGRPQNYRPDGGDQTDPWLTVIGIVGNVRQRGINSEPGLDVYVSDQQVFSPESYLAIRTRLEPASLLPQVKRAVWSVDPEQSVFDVQTMDERVQQTMWQQKLAGLVFAIFAGIAIVLAAVGIYGVMSYTVNQRTREFGIRMALGAEPRGIVRLVLTEGLVLTLKGIVCGALGALLIARLLRSSLFGVTATDPAIYFAILVGLTILSLAACYLPARRALRLDPNAALRDE